MIIGIAAMILGLMLLIVVHEFGHWFVARLFGMWTPVFSIGFGPRKWSIVLGRFWDTEWRLSPIPLGGYVALPEMGDESNAQEIAKALGLPERPLRQYAIWKRMCVACAGVVMNTLLALVMLFGVFAFKGQPEPQITSTFVASLTPDVTIASAAGLQANDVILSVGGVSTVDPDALHDQLVAHKGQPVVLHVRRGATQELDITVVPNADGRVGIVLGVNEEMVFKPMSTGAAAIRATTVTGNGLYRITYAILGMVHLVPATPGATASSMHSIVGIVQFGATAWQVSFVQYVILLATISLNLAVFNILPIPILDGGFVVFMAIEKVRGKPLSADTQNRLKTIFLCALLALFLFGLMNDFTHPLGK